MTALAPLQRTYSESFKDHFIQMRDFTVKRMRNAEAFLGLLNQRIECEQSYCAAMKKIGNSNRCIGDGYC